MVDFPEANAALAELSQQSEVDYLKATRMLLTVVHNLWRDPENTRFHRIKTSSKMIKSILKMRGVVNVLHAVGFDEQSDPPCFSLAAEPDTEMLEYVLDRIVSERKKTDELEAWELFPTDLALKDPIGGGKFGDVYTGLWCGQDVAIKTLKPGYNEGSMDEFVQEANIMKSFCHPNVVSLLGVILGQEPAFIVLELMDNCLLDVLREETLDVNKRHQAVMEIAIGLEYVHSLNFLHCDIAARNVLVSKTGTMKVSDFGLARKANTDECNIKGKHVKFPLRWVAPEVFSTKVLTKASDVWSFGVLCWEVMTNGGVPYEDKSNKEVKTAVRGGYRMPCPSEDFYSLYQLVAECWDEDMSGRPPFKRIVERMIHVRSEQMFHLAEIQRANTQRIKQKSKSGWIFGRKKDKHVISRVGEDGNLLSVDNPGNRRQRRRSSSGGSQSSPRVSRPSWTAMLRRRFSSQSTGSNQDAVDSATDQLQTCPEQSKPEPPVVERGILRVHTLLVSPDQRHAVLPASKDTRSSDIVAKVLKKTGQRGADMDDYCLVVVHRSKHTTEPLAADALVLESCQGNDQDIYICQKEHANQLFDMIEKRMEDENDELESLVSEHTESIRRRRNQSREAISAPVALPTKSGIYEGVADDDSDEGGAQASRLGVSRLGLSKELYDDSANHEEPAPARKASSSFAAGGIHGLAGLQEAMHEDSADELDTRSIPDPHMQERMAIRGVDVKEASGHDAATGSGSGSDVTTAVTLRVPKEARSRPVSMGDINEHPKSLVRMNSASTEGDIDAEHPGQDGCHDPVESKQQPVDVSDSCDDSGKEEKRAPAPPPKPRASMIDRAKKRDTQLAKARKLVTSGQQGRDDKPMDELAQIMAAGTQRVNQVLSEFRRAVDSVTSSGSGAVEDPPVVSKLKPSSCKPDAGDGEDDTWHALSRLMATSPVSKTQDRSSPVLFLQQDEQRHSTYSDSMSEYDGAVDV